MAYQPQTVTCRKRSRISLMIFRQNRTRGSRRWKRTSQHDSWTISQRSHSYNASDSPLRTLLWNIFELSGIQGVRRGKHYLVLRISSDPMKRTKIHQNLRTRAASWQVFNFITRSNLWLLSNSLLERWYKHNILLLIYQNHATLNIDFYKNVWITLVFTHTLL